MKPVVIIESPYAGDTEANIQYARECMLDSIKRGEAPFASHLLYTQCLDDTKPEERELGLECAEMFYVNADIVAVYVDRGISEGMRRGMKLANRLCIDIEERRIK